MINNSTLAKDDNFKYRHLLITSESDSSRFTKIMRLTGIRKKSTPYKKSYAIIAGVWNYKFDKLDMAEKDFKRLIKYLTHYESFDIIVKLANDDFSIEKLDYFLGEFFPNELKKNKDSRFLFAFSGHGTTKVINDKKDGYILFSNAKDKNDYKSALSLSKLIQYVDKQKNALHTLVLVNSCFAGAGLHHEPYKLPKDIEIAGDTNDPFPQTTLDDRIPIEELMQHKSYHIFVAGSENEQVMGHKRWYGSLFFHAIFGAIGGKNSADHDENGFITFPELEQFVRPVVINESERKQHPQHERRTFVVHSNEDIEGSFIFFNKEKLIKNVHVSRHPDDVELGGEFEYDPYDLVCKVAYISRYICRKSSEEQLPIEMKDYLFSIDQSQITKGFEKIKQIQTSCNNALIERRIDRDYYYDVFGKSFMELCLIYHFDECTTLPTVGNIPMNAVDNLYMQLADEGERRWKSF